MSADKPSGPFSSLKPEDFIRGATPEDIVERCLTLCRSYIGGSWCSARPSDITVSRITGGISNQVYRVRLAESVPQASASIYQPEPTDVTIKLYESKRLLSYHPDDPQRLNDNIVLTVMSEAGLGPKVYGIFNEGFIQAYVPHRKVGRQLMKEPTILRAVAHILARVHHLSVPIRKEPYWNVRQAGDMITAAYEYHPVKQLFADYPTLAAYDIREQYQWLKEQVAALDCPLVFCHNDFLGNNILVTEPDNKLTLIDLEYSSYGSRGYDLANFLSQWDREPNDYENLDMPEEEVMIRFIELYRDGAELLQPGYKTKPENSVAQLLYETKLMMAVFFLFWVAFHINQREALIEAIPFDTKVTYAIAENYYAKFINFKKRILGE